MSEHVIYGPACETGPEHVVADSPWREGLKLAVAMQPFDPITALVTAHLTKLHAQIAARLRGLPPGWRVAVSPPQFSETRSTTVVGYKLADIGPGSVVPRDWIVYGPMQNV